MPYTVIRLRALQCGIDNDHDCVLIAPILGDRFGCVIIAGYERTLQDAERFADGLNVDVLIIDFVRVCGKGEQIAVAAVENVVFGQFVLVLAERRAAIETSRAVANLASPTHTAGTRDVIRHVYILGILRIGVGLAVAE